MRRAGGRYASQVVCEALRDRVPSPAPRARAVRALSALGLLLALLIGGLAGCRGTAAPAARTGPSPTATPAGRLLVGLTAEDATGRRQAAFRTGEPVVLVLVVENRGSAPVTLSLPTAQRYDFWVERNGQEVWRWSTGRAFAAAVTRLELRPGERQLFRESWSQVGTDGRQVPAGTYSVRGALLTGGEPLPTPPLSITITE